MCSTDTLLDVGSFPDNQHETSGTSVNASLQTKKSAVRKYENQPFALDDRKLSRLVEISKERLVRKTNEPPHEFYRVDFTHDKTLKLRSLEEVLALDNSVGNPIVRLSVVMAAVPITPDTNVEEEKNVISAKFGRREDYEPEIQLRATSDDLSWLTETMGALEEQAERSFQTRFPYALKGMVVNPFAGILIALGAFFLGFVSFFANNASGSNVNPWEITSTEAAQLRALSQKAASDSDKLNYVFQLLSRSLPPEKGSLATRHLSDPHTYLVVIPVAVAVIAAIVALLTTYPSLPGMCCRKMRTMTGFGQR